MKNKDMLKIGFSGAASWAWGTSLIMGQQIAQEKGLMAWIIWATCNFLTLALFGFLFNKKIIKPETYNRKEVKVIALIIQLFCLLVQLNFINQQFFKILGDPVMSYLITIVIGFIFVLMVFRKGLITSIHTDVFQWLIAMVAIVGIIGVGIYTHAPFMNFATTNGSNVLWGAWSGLVLFAGPIGDVQHWQRAEADKSRKGYYISAVAFAFYMLLILGMAIFEFSPVMNGILLVAVLCITTSTIDSIAVATHEIRSKKLGTTLCLLMSIFWGLFVQIGIIDLWSSFGVIRYALAISILLLPFCLQGKSRITYPLILLSVAIMILFIVCGQIAINNVFGMICFAISIIIFGYLVYQTYKNRSKYYVGEKAEHQA